MDNLEVKKILIEESLRKSQMSQIFDVVSNDKMVFFRSLQQYKNNKLFCTTGISSDTFLLDRHPEITWDSANYCWE